MEDFFLKVSEAPADSILGLAAAFRLDPRKDKQNLSVGVYQTEDGKISILSSVKEAEKLILESEVTKNYLPIEGEALYLKEVASLVLGEDLYKAHQSSFSVIQTLGGVGALRLGAEFAKQQEISLCSLPDPTWPNHQGIFSQCGLNLPNYPYYDFQKKELGFEKMCQALGELPPRSLVLLHVCCHNPSGADLTKEQWKLLADLMQKKQLIPFFDAAYLGFDRSFEEDAFPIRLFVSQGIEFLLAVSFSKNFSLYAERVGAFFLFSNPKRAPAILSQLKVLVRRNYSNPTLHGAKIVSTVLTTPSLRKKWEEELMVMRERIAFLKRNLVSCFFKHSSKKDYSYLLDKKGLFSFCDLSKDQVGLLKDKHGIYMTSDGRMSIAGLNHQNIDAIVKAIIEVGG